MSLCQLLDTEVIRVPITSTTKDEVIREMISILYETGRIKDEKEVLRATMEREKALSTGIGNGVAVPHCKSAATDRLVAALGISKEGIDFDTADGKPAHIIFALIAEENNPGPHVKALARLSRLLSRQRVRDDLIAATGPEEILDIIRKNETEE